MESLRFPIHWTNVPSKDHSSLVVYILATSDGEARYADLAPGLIQFEVRSGPQRGPEQEVQSFTEGS